MERTDLASQNHNFTLKRAVARARDRSTARANQSASQECRFATPQKKIIIKEYRGIQENTGEYKRIPGNTREYMGIQGNTREYVGIQMNNVICIAIR